MKLKRKKREKERKKNGYDDNAEGDQGNPNDF